MQTAIFSCKGKKRHGVFRFLRKCFFFLLFLLISVSLIYNLQILPALLTLTKAQATTDVTRQLHAAVRQVAAGASNNLVRLSRGSDGRIVSLETDSATIASLSAKTVESVIDTLSHSGPLSVSFPIGNLSGGALLTGRGPKITVPIVVSPAVTCEVENEFAESGINQTLHRVVAEIEVEIVALLPFSPQKIPVEAEYCLAETVIVGNVPDAYTKINRLTDEIAENEIDDIYDFGGSVDREFSYN